MRDYAEWNKRWAGTGDQLQDFHDLCHHPAEAMVRLGKEEFFQEELERAEVLTEETTEAWFDRIWTLSPVDQVVAMKTLRPAEKLQDVAHKWAPREFSHWVQVWKDHIFGEPGPDSVVYRPDFEDGCLNVCVCGHEAMGYQKTCPACGVSWKEEVPTANGTHRTKGVNHEEYRLYSDGTRVERAKGLI